MLEKYPSFSKQLEWYYSVVNNELPAKYLICSRIPVNFNNKDSEEDLWMIHAIGVKKVLEVFNAIRSGQSTLEEFDRPDQSLLDLNSVLAYKMLEKCQFCEWKCNVNRTKEGNKKLGTCKLTTESRVGSFFHHRGEEFIYRGIKGSGTIFFTSCNMRCAFCQNADISHDKDRGESVSPKQVAAMVYKLAVEGCHNINFVGGDPTVNFHIIVEAIRLVGNSFKPHSFANITSMNPDFMLYSTQPSKVKYGTQFNIPMLWNSNFYMSEKTINILRTIIDVWLPDFKFSNNTCAIKLSRTPKYIETITRNLLLLRDWNESFSIRHLVMPDHIDCCSSGVFEWIHQNMPEALVNVMDQYHPDCFANAKSLLYNPKYEEISRYLTKDEILKAFTLAKYYKLKFEELSFEKNVSGISI